MFIRFFVVSLAVFVSSAEAAHVTKIGKRTRGDDAEQSASKRVRTKAYFSAELKQHLLNDTYDADVHGDLEDYAFALARFNSLDADELLFHAKLLLQSAAHRGYNQAIREAAAATELNPNDKLALKRFLNPSCDAFTDAFLKNDVSYESEFSQNSYGERSTCTA